MADCTAPGSGQFRCLVQRLLWPYHYLARQTLRRSARWHFWARQGGNVRGLNLPLHHSLLVIKHFASARQYQCRGGTPTSRLVEAPFAPRLRRNSAPTVPPVDQVMLSG